MAFHDLRDTRLLLSYEIDGNEKEHFLKFVREGEKDENGNFKKDKNGVEMTGVIAWARAFRLFDTRFYVGAKPNGNLLFVATADRTIPEEGQPDWAEIPGFLELFPSNNKMNIRDDLNNLVKP